MVRGGGGGWRDAGSVAGAGDAAAAGAVGAGAITSWPTCWLTVRRAVGSRSASVTRTSTWSSVAMVDSPTMPHLLWSATTSTRRAAAMRARLVSASTRLGVVRPGPLVDAVHAEDQRVDVQRAQRGDGDRAGQGVGGGAHPAGEDHREVVARRVVQQLGHAGASW